MKDQNFVLILLLQLVHGLESGDPLEYGSVQHYGFGEMTYAMGADGSTDVNRSTSGAIQECDPDLLVGVWYGSCSSNTGLDHGHAVCSDAPCEQPYR
jgi:hypothetical protein